jgi:pimeloyl-ACP methyl ester carboxylesterase
VLRMDIGGTGDSGKRAGSLEQVVYSPAVVQDIAAAMEHIRRACGVEQFHAVGICSGAYHALKAASAGLPLESITLINPLTFSWHGGLSLEIPEHRVTADIARYRTNMFRPASWMKLLRGGVNLRHLTQVLLRRAKSYGSELVTLLGHLLRIPMRDDLGVELTRIAARGVDLRFVFATDEPGIELLHAKGGFALRRLRAEGRLRVHLIPGADHTFTDRQPREALLDFLADELGGPPPFREAFPASRAADRV